MSWIRRSPFSKVEDAAERMLRLLCEQAERAGTALSDEEKKILLAEKGHASPSSELRQKVDPLIKQLLQREATTQECKDPKSFGNTLEWAGDQANPNIVAFTEDVICGGWSPGGLPRLHRRAWLLDKAQLIGCGILIVVLMLLVVGAFAVFFGRR